MTNLNKDLGIDSSLAIVQTERTRIDIEEPEPEPPVIQRGHLIPIVPVIVGFTTEIT